MDCDFEGWATKSNVRCSDNRVIMQDAFKVNDGKTVPLVWNHEHGSPDNVLGHALLENRPEGVYAYGFFNDTESGQVGRELLKHHDICALSIYANNIKQRGDEVIHGNIREVSLVLAGANPGAFITDVVKHSDDGEDSEVEMYFLDDQTSVVHSDGSEKNSKEDDVTKDANKSSDSEADKTSSNDETVADIVNTMNEKQKTVMYALISAAANGEFDDAVDNTDDDSGEETTDMKHNVFESDTDTNNDNIISHDEIISAIKDAKRYGSMKESFIEHGIDDIAYAGVESGSDIRHADYGIDHVDYLFPDARNVTNAPTFIKRSTDWVAGVMNGTSHTPFSRIKSVFADITEDEARAKGYTKGKLKKEEVFSLLKRTTTPTTVYKKQKMDRDDVIDITDFDVIAWLKSEMRMMLDEEIARAILVGDGRLNSSDDKIKEDCIRPIWTDEELYTIRTSIDSSKFTTDDAVAKEFIRTAIKSRTDYKGSGNPTLYITEDLLTTCLLLTDAQGRDLYDSVDKLATKLRVSKIVTVPVLEGLTRAGSGSDSTSTFDLMGIIVNLSDYTVGADKGGAVNMFDDFDIDYNQQKYLIETRCSGALTTPKSAIAIELKKAKGGA